jgi:hypothetical protein
MNRVTLEVEGEKRVFALETTEQFLLYAILLEIQKGAETKEIFVKAPIEARQADRKKGKG